MATVSRGRVMAVRFSSKACANRILSNGPRKRNGVICSDFNDAACCRNN